MSGSGKRRHALGARGPASGAGPRVAVTRRGSGLVFVAIGAGGLVVLAGVAAVVISLVGRPSLSLSSAGTALVDARVGGFEASLGRVEASSGGRRVGLVGADGGLVPVVPLAEGERVEIRASARAPGWLRWLVGGPVTAKTTVRVPAARLASRVAVSTSADRVPVRFDGTVSVVRYQTPGGVPHVVRFATPTDRADLVVSRGVTGVLDVSSAPRPWEPLPARAATLRWFAPPPGRGPVVTVDPLPGTVTASSDTPIRLTFDRTVSQVLGRRRPVLSPSVPGSWSEPTAHSLVFTPEGFGFGPGTTVTVSFGRQVRVVGAATQTTAAPSTTVVSRLGYGFQVAPGSLERLAEILAQLHYLPLRFQPAAGVTMPSTLQQQVDAISRPPAGSFSWRWASTPASLQAQWAPGVSNPILKGALMAFEATRSNYNYDGYTLERESVSQIADASTWQALIQASDSDALDPNPYSYVSVTKTLPETLTLWQNGTVVLTSLANTGIAQDQTADGTYPIYLRYTQDYMSGTNPNGTPYHDLVHWINYFNGSDAVHGFVRASYGFPQSLGCVELPVATAKVAFSDLAIGDLVTVAGPS